MRMNNLIQTKDVSSSRHQKVHGTHTLTTAADFHTELERQTAVCLFSSLALPPSTMTTQLPEHTLDKKIQLAVGTGGRELRPQVVEGTR